MSETITFSSSRIPGAELGDDKSERIATTTDERRALWLTLPEAEMLLMLVCASPLTGGEAECDLFDRMGAFRHSFSAAGADRENGHPCDSLPLRRRQAKKITPKRLVWGTGLMLRPGAPRGPLAKRPERPAC